MKKYVFIVREEGQHQKWDAGAHECYERAQFCCLGVLSGTTWILTNVFVYTYEKFGRGCSGCPPLQPLEFGIFLRTDTGGLGSIYEILISSATTVASLS